MVRKWPVQRCLLASLTVRITAPPVPGWAVQRPRISKLIADGTQRRSLAILTGPPGAGETMALALWAAAESGTAAWVSLDEFGNRPEMRSNA